MLFAEGSQLEPTGIAAVIASIFGAGWFLNQRVMHTVDRIADRIAHRIVAGMSRAAMKLAEKLKEVTPPRPGHCRKQDDESNLDSKL